MPKTDQKNKENPLPAFRQPNFLKAKNSFGKATAWRQKVRTTQHKG